jgi:hypothetical protein
MVGIPHQRGVVGQFTYRSAKTKNRQQGDSSENECK